MRLCAQCVALLVRLVYLCRSVPNEKSQPMSPDREKKRPGPPRRRTFYDRIGFQIATTLHEEMKSISEQRDLRFEDVYAEAIRHFLEIRDNKKILYTPAPARRIATRVTVPMEPSLAQSARAVSLLDQQRLTDVFQTAVWLYLDSLDRLPP